MTGSSHYEITKRFIFFGFLEKQDRLIRSWLHVELSILVFVCFCSLICVVNSYAMLAWVVVYLITTISLAIISVCRCMNFYNLSLKTKDLILHHKDRALKRVFRIGPAYLTMIIFLDVLYPATWILSFIIKLAYSRNASNMKMMIILPQNL